MQTDLAMTDRQAAFARYLVDGRHYLEAYKLAGYTGPQPVASRLTRHPAVSAAIRAEMVRRLQDEDAPAARKLLRRFLEDEQCDKKLRVDCAKTLLSRGGYVEPKAAEPAAPGTKEPSEMSGKELDDMIDRLRTELRQRESKAIDITPQPVDEFD
mgnify:CR=1 FL=1